MEVKSKLCVAMFCAAGVISCLFSGEVWANLITGGDFDSGTQIVSINGEWKTNKHDLNTWYGWETRRGTDFYKIENGMATVERGSWDNSCFDVRSVKLAQVVAAPVIGKYKLSFDYQISDDASQYSVFRVFGIDAGSDGNFKMNMESWDLSAKGCSADRLYDQGGKYSYLSETNGMGHVDTQMIVSKRYDYFVVYAAFSYDGCMFTSDQAFLDNVSLSSATTVPEPASVILLAGGMAGLLMRKKVHRN